MHNFSKIWRPFSKEKVPYLVLRLTGQQVLIIVFALMVIVETLERLGDEFRAYRLRESYTGLISRRRPV